MGASITILGINNDIHQSIIFERLVNRYYESFNRGVEPMIGLYTIFEVGVKKYCFEINEMLIYHNLGFKWEGSEQIGTYDNGFIVSKKQLLDLIDWYIALCYVFDNSKEAIPNPTIYVDEALSIKHNYNSEYDFFSFSYCKFFELKKEIQSNIYQNYLWIYSF